MTAEPGFLRQMTVRIAIFIALLLFLVPLLYVGVGRMHDHARYDHDEASGITGAWLPAGATALTSRGDDRERIYRFRASEAAVTAWAAGLGIALKPITAPQRIEQPEIMHLRTPASGSDAAAWTAYRDRIYVTVDQGLSADHKPIGEDGWRIMHNHATGWTHVAWRAW